MSKVSFIILILFILSSLSLIADDLTDKPEVTPEPTPVPYEKDEFPQWAKDLRRAEVVMVGSFPFAFFFSKEIYDIYRFASNDFNSGYEPWPFNGADSMPYDEPDKQKILITALSLSACIALADYIIVKVTRKDRRGS